MVTASSTFQSTFRQIRPWRWWSAESSPVSSTRCSRLVSCRGHTQSQLKGQNTPLQKTLHSSQQDSRRSPFEVSPLPPRPFIVVNSRSGKSLRFREQGVKPSLSEEENAVEKRMSFVVLRCSLARSPFQTAAIIRVASNRGLEACGKVRFMSLKRTSELSRKEREIVR